MSCQPHLLIVFVLCDFRCLVEAVDTAEVDLLVRKINSIHRTWTARVNPPAVLDNIETSLRLTKNSILNKSTLPTQRFIGRFTVPKAFDARDEWPHCSDIIGAVKDQGACGSCWAVQTAAMLSDRLCIESRGSKQIVLSAQDLIECCKCGGNEIGSCIGGDADKALKYWMEEGIVSGGDYGSNEGCKPYSVESFKSNHIKCQKRCTNKQYRKSYFKDKNFGKSNYRITGGEVHIQREIIRYGPVTAFMMSYADLKAYKDGVYNSTGGEYKGPHIIKVIGWGKENGVKYWLCMNSWGKKWGLLGGYFKILRGKNHCQIENIMRAGTTLRRHSVREALFDTINKGILYKPSATQCLTLIFIMVNSV